MSTLYVVVHVLRVYASNLHSGFFWLFWDNVSLSLVKTGWQQWHSQPRNFWGAKMFDFRRITLFCLETRLSKHKMSIFSKNLEGNDPFGPPWLRLWVATLLCSSPRFDIASRGVRQPVQPHTYAQWLVRDDPLAQSHFAVVNCSDAVMSVFTPLFQHAAKILPL